MTAELREKLSRLGDVLSRCGDPTGLCIADALAETDGEVLNFLRSNELWGGSGSVADQGALTAPPQLQGEFKAALVELGEAQIAAGVENVRTKTWVEVFSGFKRREI